MRVTTEREVKGVHIFVEWKSVFDKGAKVHSTFCLRMWFLTAGTFIWKNIYLQTLSCALRMNFLCTPFSSHALNTAREVFDKWCKVISNFAILVTDDCIPRGRNKVISSSYTNYNPSGHPGICLLELLFSAWPPYLPFPFTKSPSIYKWFCTSTW